MIEHNVVVVGGVEYKAVKNFSPRCGGCAGEDSMICGRLGACSEDERDDGVNVKYKVHYRHRHDEFIVDDDDL